MEVKDVFDDAFCDVTKKIVKLDLHKSDEKMQDAQAVSDFQDYREMIQTQGYVNAVIVCRFSNEMFHYITNTMNNGVTPSGEELPLYINEYINIACGCAISRINDMTGQLSRLTVPRFYQCGEPLEGDLDFREQRFLSYDSRLGKLQVYLFYSLNDYEEGK